MRQTAQWKKIGENVYLKTFFPAPGKNRASDNVF